MRNLRQYRFAMVMFLVLTMPLVGHGSTIFSTFGPGMSYNNNFINSGATEWFVSNGANPAVGPQWDAMSFTSAANYSVTQIDVALGEGVNGDAQPQDVQMSLWTNVPGAGSPVGQPGVELGMWVIHNVPNNTSQVFTISGISGVSLLSGQTYWLVAGPSGVYCDAGWYVNNQGFAGNGADVSYDGVNWLFAGSAETYAAADVLGTASTTPEPGSLTLLATGLGAIAGVFRRTLRANGDAQPPRVSDR